MPARPAGAPRSLADDLRARDDAQLLTLLRSRPDLTAPVPADLTSLAARATTRASVGRALDGLDAFTLQAVEVLAVLPEPASRSDVARLLGVRPGVAAGPVDRLRELALLWGRDGALRLVTHSVPTPPASDRRWPSCSPAATPADCTPSRAASGSHPSRAPTASEPTRRPRSRRIWPGPTS